jgi:hypothetical protein
MNRNNIRYFTQTQTTDTGANTGTGTSSNSNSNSDSDSNAILFAVVTGNLREIQRLVNSSNVNTIIDTVNNYTALHHAVKLPSNDIVEYLMKCGANPNLKQKEGKDSIDLSIEANKRFLINRVIADSSRGIDEIYTKLDDAKYNLRSVERRNGELVEENNYLKKVNQENTTKISQLKDEIVIGKRKLEQSETAFTNLLKKNQKK